MANVSKARGSLREVVHQSPPVDLTSSYDPAWIGGKTVIITGGASGFGAGFARRWASLGANVIVGDISDKNGEALVAEMRKESNNNNHHYVRCDVTNWQSQVDFFKTAARLSPTGGIDAVVANAGITDPHATFETPQNLDAEAPPKPSFKTLEVNLIGVMYTAHLAFFWLPRNRPNEKTDLTKEPAAGRPDRHILLIGSVASLMPIPGQVQYGISKHGVLGMFRALRGTSFMNGIRVNMLCPYFIETPIIPAAARILLAGGAMGQPEDVVEAGTRLVADSRIAGRALVIGPKLKVAVDDDWQLVPMSDKNGKAMSIWECYADDFEQCESFTGRFISLLNAVEVARGWFGWGYDMMKAFAYPIFAGGKWVG